MNNLNRRGFLTSTKRRSRGGLNRNRIRSNDVPNAEECSKFWSDSSGVRNEHNREAEWLKDLKRERVNDECPQEI